MSGILHGQAQGYVWYTPSPSQLGHFQGKAEAGPGTSGRWFRYLGLEAYTRESPGLCIVLRL